MAGDGDSVGQLGKNLISEHFSRLDISNPKMRTNDIGFKDLLEEDRYRVDSLFNKQISFCCACAPSRHITDDDKKFRDFLFFSRYGIFRGPLQYTRTTKLNVFVLYIKKVRFCCCVTSFQRQETKNAYRQRCGYIQLPL